jgi:hypothetical protein
MKRGVFLVLHHCLQPIRSIWSTNYYLRSTAVYEAVYYAAHHFGVAGEGVSTLQKDLIHDRGGVGSPAHVELGTVTGSATLLQIGGAGRKLALTAAGGLRRFKE